MRACPASWRWTSDRALLTARGPLRRTSRTPHRPGSPVPGFPEHAVGKQNGCSVASTAPLTARQHRSRRIPLRVACILITHLRARAEMERRPHLRDRPVVIVDRTAARGRTLVAGQFPAAGGVTAGMTLEQAMSLQTDTVVLDAGEPYYRRLFDRVLRAPSGSDRPGRGGGTRHGIFAHRRAGAVAPGRGPGRLGPAERRSRVSQAAPGRCRLEVPGLCGRQD